MAMEIYGWFREICFWVGAVILSMSLMWAFCLFLAWVHLGTLRLWQGWRSRRVLRLLDRTREPWQSPRESESELDRSVRRHKRSVGLPL